MCLEFTRRGRQLIGSHPGHIECYKMCSGIGFLLVHAAMLDITAIAWRLRALGAPKACIALAGHVGYTGLQGVLIWEFPKRSGPGGP